MIQKIFAAALAAAAAFSLASCASGQTPENVPAPESTAAPSESAPPSPAGGSAPDQDTEITLLLDWTPNTNHTGVYVADKLGYYADAGVKVTIVEGSGESVTPLVASGRGQFGVDFQDSLAPALIADVPVTAVAALLQHNTSGIISLQGKGMERPKGLEGKSYATWDLPVEKATLKYVVEKDGGDFGQVKLIPNTVTNVISALQSNIDAVWIYYGWDGVATGVKGLDTDFFAFRDIDPVFDYYTPVLIANNEFLESEPTAARAFLAATAKGYEYAAQHPDEAAEILLEAVPELDPDIVPASQKWLADQYIADAKVWGYIDASRWDAFYKWLWDNQLLEKEIPAGFGFDNGYLPE